MKNVSDLLKSELFRENQLYPFLISKFKEGTVPTDINEFLRCCSWDKEKCALEFCYNFGELESEKVHILFGTSRTIFKWKQTDHLLLDDKHLYLSFKGRMILHTIVIDFLREYESYLRLK